MSINTKKISNQYYQEENAKVMYVYAGYPYVKIYSEKYASQWPNSVNNHILKIQNHEIVANQIAFFNKIPFHRNSARIYYVLFNENLYEVSLSSSESEYSIEELSFLIKEKIYKENKKFEQIKKQVELYEKFETKQKPERREPIPEDVKFEVWRRDGGKCVICGSQNNLEFDHIIPFSKGGSSTARNLQLLCQNCNRHKSDKI